MANLWLFWGPLFILDFSYGQCFFPRLFSWPVFSGPLLFLLQIFHLSSVFPPGFSHGQCFFPQAFLHGQFVQALCFFIDFSGFYHGQFLGPLFFLDFSGFSHGKFFTPRILFRFFICPVFFPQAFLMTTNFSGPLFFVQIFHMASVFFQAFLMAFQSQETRISTYINRKHQLNILEL